MRTGDEYLILEMWKDNETFLKIVNLTGISVDGTASSDISEYLSRRILLGEFKNMETMETKENRILNKAEKAFQEICIRFYISFFDENELQRILSGAVSTVQDPDNWNG